MSFQWLHMRIGEEKDRRDREAEVLARLPRAFDEMEASLTGCVEAFAAEFGGDSVKLRRDGLKLSANGDGGAVEVNPLLELPGIEIRRNGSAREIKIGMLPGDRVFYLDVTADQYLSMDELSRLILDRVLFPKLQE
jgi:hypothetical protein